MGMQELQITMLGHSGVGKTTLLTAMYQQFEQGNVGADNLQLTPDDDSSQILQDRLIELKSSCDVFEAQGRVGLERTEAVAGPGSLRSFKFDLGKTGQAPSLRLNFRDYPGGYHEGTEQEKAFVRTLLSQSAAVLIPIDAPALMEENGKYHEEKNRPQQIHDIFKKAYQSLDSPKLIIFAPVKCEKYLKDEKTAKELSNRICEEYEGLIRYFKSERLSPLIATVITPVQTVGSLIFSRVELDEVGTPNFYFRKIKHDAKYNPQDSEQPLRYLLRFLLKLHLDKRNIGFLNFIRDLMGSDQHLKKAIDDFSRGCKTTGGFTILTGKKLLS